MMWTEQHLKKTTDSIIKNRERLSPPIENDQRLRIKNRRYLGSKYKLLDFIWQVVHENTKDVYTVADIFGGTGVVAERFNIAGKRIIINDILYANYLAYWTWFSDQTVDYTKIEKLITQFNHARPAEDNYVSEHFGGTYFTEYNARKIGFIREEIEKLSGQLNFREKAVLVTSLIYAMDKVANTVGHYDAYRRNLDALKGIKLLVPELRDRYNRGNKIYKENANRLVRKISADLFYIDPPYNSRQYGDSYHLLENIAEWKKPDVCGVARKMVNRAHIKSDYCTMKAVKAFKDLISNINGRYILVSYNNMAQKGVGRSNAKISAEEIIQILKTRGKVKTFEKDFQAYTTGKTNIEDHKEILYLCEINSEI